MRMITRFNVAFKKILLGLVAFIFALGLGILGSAAIADEAWADGADETIWYGISNGTLYVSGSQTSRCTNSASIEDFCDEYGSARPWEDDYTIADNITTVTLDGPFAPSNMANMFSGLNYVTDISGLASLDTQYVTNMDHALSNMNSLADISAVANWNTSNVENMEMTFSLLGCAADDPIDMTPIANWDVSKVTSTHGMFMGCGAAVIDLSNWDLYVVQSTLANGRIIYKLTDMGQMFQSCPNLTTIYVAPDTDLTSRLRPTSTSGIQMFYGSGLLVGGNGTTYSVSDSSYARVDGLNDNPGYFTAKAPTQSPAIALAALITEAQAARLPDSNISINGSDIPSSQYWVTQAQQNAFDAALAAAQTANVDPSEAYTALSAALTAYNAAKTLGSAAITVTHHLNANGAADLTNIVYTVDFAAKTPTNEEKALGHEEVPEGITPGTVTFTPTTTANWTGTEWEKTANVYTSPTSLFGAASGFQRAGIYLFDVTETVAGGSAASSVNPAKWSWTSADAAPESYVLKVEVRNGNNGLEYGDVAIETVEQTPQKVQALEFSSQYIANTTLDVSKLVTGTYGDKTHAFQIQVTLYLPSWVEGSVSDNVTATNATTSATAFTTEANGSKSIVYTTSLADLGSASFNVPVGTRYKIDEVETSFNGINYDPSIVWNVG